MVRLRRSRHIVIDILLLLVPLHIILIDQLLDILLDIRRIQNPTSFRCHDYLADQLRVRDLFAGFHDPDDCRLGFELAIGGHAFVCGLVFGFGFFGLDLVYLDAVFRVGEGVVNCECVGCVDVFALWGFAEDAVPGAGEGLQGAFEFVVVCDRVERKIKSVKRSSI